MGKESIAIYRALNKDRLFVHGQENIIVILGFSILRLGRLR